ncbi:FecR domain-containing protein [Spirosoma flavum]|uniref:FecR domain-containing protein n=1 Tax=Spirosoma flavum TaxID=2048557 RepID=A0ABW6AE78_9BACT
MNYLHFTEEDFAADEFFQRWVIEQDIESKLFWQKWLAEHPEKKPIIKRAQWLLQTISFNETWSATERASMWQTIQANLTSGTGETVAIIPLWGRPIWRRLGWIAAASVALLLVSFGLFYSTLQTKKIETSFGEMKTVTLDDGSIVTLNSKSKLHFANDFLEKSSRDVWIEGEAFFDVANRTVNGKKVPFIVHANKLSVQVLGTAFNVLNRRDKVAVALERGSVNVVDEENEKNTVMLKPGEKVSQADEKALLVKQKVRIEDYTSWKSKVILFKQKSLPDIADMMKDMYDIDVVIDNPALKQETFTGSFPSDSAEVFFEKLKKMYPIDIHKDGNVFHLK